MNVSLAAHEQAVNSQLPGRQSLGTRVETTTTLAVRKRPLADGALLAELLSAGPLLHAHDGTACCRRA